MVKPRAIHIELNNSGDVHIEPSGSRRNVRAIRHLVQRTRRANTDQAMVGHCAGTFDGFESIFKPLLIGSNLKVREHNEDAGKHLTMDSILSDSSVLVCMWRKNIAVISTPSLLMNPLPQCVLCTGSMGWEWNYVAMSLTRCPIIW